MIQNKYCRNDIVWLCPGYLFGFVLSTPATSTAIVVIIIIVIVLVVIVDCVESAQQIQSILKRRTLNFKIESKRTIASLSSSSTSSTVVWYGTKQKYANSAKVIKGDCSGVFIGGENMGNLLAKTKCLWQTDKTDYIKSSGFDCDIFCITKIPKHRDRDKILSGTLRNSFRNQDSGRFEWQQEGISYLYIVFLFIIDQEMIHFYPTIHVLPRLLMDIVHPDMISQI